MGGVQCRSRELGLRFRRGHVVAAAGWLAGWLGDGSWGQWGRHQHTELGGGPTALGICLICALGLGDAGCRMPRLPAVDALREAEKPLGMQTGPPAPRAAVGPRNLEAWARDLVPGAAGQEERTHHCTGWPGSGPGRLRSPNSCSLPADALLSSTLGPGKKGSQWRGACSWVVRPALPSSSPHGQ